MMLPISSKGGAKDDDRASAAASDLSRQEAGATHAASSRLLRPADAAWRDTSEAKASVAVTQAARAE